MSVCQTGKPATQASKKTRKTLLTKAGLVRDLPAGFLCGYCRVRGRIRLAFASPQRRCAPISFRELRRSDLVWRHVQEFIQMPTRDYTSYKLTFCGAQATVQSPDLASATANLLPLKGRISPVEVRKFNLCQERIYGEVPHVKFRDSEQFQGFCIRGNKTPVAVRDDDCIQGTSQQVSQIILSRQTDFPHP